MAKEINLLFKLQYFIVQFLSNNFNDMCVQRSKKLLGCYINILQKNLQDLIYPISLSSVLYSILSSERVRMTVELTHHLTYVMGVF